MRGAWHGPPTAPQVPVAAVVDGRDSRQIGRIGAAVGFAGQHADAMTEIVPDTKDWTWVLREPCPECGYDARAVERESFGRRVRDNSATWTAVLGRASATARPEPGVWSPLEYACHVRDVHRIFLVRLRSMLDEDAPRFANWDQDETAVEQAYGEQDPATVAAELAEAAEAVASVYDGVPVDDEATWARSGVRSDGSEFTVDSLGRYHLHDIVHHAWDVRAEVGRAVVEAYAAHTSDYAEATAELRDEVLDWLEDFAAAVGTGGHVLEIGSGGGRDAQALEERGLRVRRTDVTGAFVDLLRGQGHQADLLDPLTDDLGGPYDGAWANACLLHVDRADLPVVLARLAGSVRAGGVLALSVKEGDGEIWSTHGTIPAPRRFVLWREAGLTAALAAAGWTPVEVRLRPGLRGESWLMIRASRGT
jgi:SAM-dependent methyltransferase